MFIPIGLGHKPKVLPLAVLGLLTFTFCYSTLNFSLVESMEQDESYQAKVDELSQLRSKAILEACPQSLSAADCKEVAKLLAETLQRAKGKPAIREPSKKPTWEETQSYAETMGRIVDFLAPYRGDPEQWPKEAKTVPSFAKIESKLEEFKEFTTSLASKKGLLTRGNFSLISLTKATFMHGGWLHLISNFLMLIVFGIYLEQRVGFAIFSMLFLVGSYIGLSTEIFLGKHGTVLGASAGLMAVMGAFYVLFIHAKMKFWLNMMLFYNRTFYLPILYTMPLFFFASDFSAVMERQASNIAHLAHLGGLGFGVLIGFIEKRINPVPAPCLYFEEAQLYWRLKKSKTFNEGFSILQILQQWNQQNENLALEAAQLVSKWKPELTPAQVHSLQQWSHEYLSHRLEKRFFHQSVPFLDQLASCANISAFVKNISWQSLMQMADHALNEGRLKLSYEIYSYLLMSQPYNPALKGLEQTCKNLETEMKRNVA